MRVCVRCLAEKPLTAEHFYRSAWSEGFRQPCIACSRIDEIERNRKKSKAARARDAVRARRHSLRVNHGLTVEEFHTLFDGQEGLCGVCSRHMCNCPGLKCASKAVVDHDHHLSGRASVRGLVCNACNKGMGNLRDTPRLLRNAAAYIEAGHPRWVQ